MENNEIKAFDPNEAMKSVKEKIKDSFVSLIPDDQWNTMVKKEVDTYFMERNSSYSQGPRASDFTNDVHNLLKAEVTSRVKFYLESNFQAIWDGNGKPICDTKIEEFILKNSGKILADMIGSTIVIALQTSGYRMNNGG